MLYEKLTVESNPIVLVRSEFGCSWIVEKFQLLTLINLRKFYKRFELTSLNFDVSMRKLLEKFTAVGGSPFMVFQNTGAVPISNIAHEGSLYLHKLINHQLC